MACVGDQGKFHYKRSRRGDAEIDRAVTNALRYCGEEFEILDFSPYGYDERQYCSPGINLAVGSLTRTPHGRYPQYHTSADDLDLVDAAMLADSLTTCLRIVEAIEGDAVFVSGNQKCEPQLGERGLYSNMGGYGGDNRASEQALLWVLNMSDGGNSLLDIAERSGMAFSRIRNAANALIQAGLLSWSTLRP